MGITPFAACSRLLTNSGGEDGAAAFDVQRASELLSVDRTVPMLVKKNYISAFDQHADLSSLAVAAEALGDADVAAETDDTHLNDVEEDDVACDKSGGLLEEVLLLKGLSALPRSSRVDASSLRVQIKREPVVTPQLIATLCDIYDVPKL